MNIGDIDVALKLVTGPAIEPISLDEAKTHLGVAADFQDDDVYIGDLMSLARQIVETTMKRALLQQTWRLSLRQWPGRDYQNWPSSLTLAPDSYYRYNFIKLPFPPLQSVMSVIYRNSNGQDLTMQPANFQPNVPNSFNVETDMEPGRIVLPFAAIWPTDILMPGAPIRITFVCGNPDIETLQVWEGFTPSMRAIKELIGYAYEYRIPPSEMRRSTVPAGIQLVIDTLLQPYRIFD